MSDDECTCGCGYYLDKLDEAKAAFATEFALLDQILSSGNPNLAQLEAQKNAINSVLTELERRLHLLQLVLDGHVKSRL